MRRLWQGLHIIAAAAACGVGCAAVGIYNRVSVAYAEDISAKMRPKGRHVFRTFFSVVVACVWPLMREHAELKIGFFSSSFCTSCTTNQGAKGLDTKKR